MSLPGSGLPEPSNLSNVFWIQLQTATERLAAAHSQHQVDTAILEQARQVLDALSGVILLVQDDTLRVVTRQGEDSAAQTIWTDRPLSDHSPTTDVLRRQHPLYFEHTGSLLSAYPEVEIQTGGTAAVASAIIPILLASTVLGVVVLDFKEPHTFTDGERHFLQTLASQCAVALNRVHMIERLNQQYQRTEAILESISDAFYTVDQDGRFTYVNHEAERLWGQQRSTLLGQSLWEMFPQAVGSEAYEAHLLAASERRVVRLEALSPVLNVWLDITIFPTKDGLAVYFKDATERKRAEMTVRELNHSLEQRVEERTRELTDERAGLDAFVDFTEAVGVETDELLLVQRAIAAVHATLDHVSVAYYQLDQHVWKAVAWSSNVPPEVVSQLRAGIPYDAPHLAEAVQLHAAVFVDRWNSATDHMDQAAMYSAAAFVPLFVDDEPPRLFAVGTQEARIWTSREQAVVRAVGRSLTLALERAAQLRRSARQNAELNARTQALEAFAELSRDLASETDRYALIRRAQEIMLSLLTPGYALYWEQAEDHWQLKSQVGDIGNTDLQRLVDEQGLPLDAPALHSTWLTGVPRYQDVYDQGADTPPEMIRHVLAAVAFRVQLYGQPIGMLAIGLFDQRSWTTTDKAVLETAIYNLVLALERAQGIEALAHSNAALQASNEELEAFNYSVSHDLMTPVRHVAGFSSLARQNLNDREKADRYLGIVDQGATRMATLIEAMLTLSRTGRQNLSMGLVDLNALVEQQRTMLMPEVVAREVEWRIAPLPLVYGDRVTLQQVMTNLLENALKYSARQNPAVIDVWAEEDSQAWTVFVRDNGAGFDPRYTDKLFGIFQRLHRHDEFPGTGVGLALVRRIIVRHGGTVSATSELGKGATFSFTLPKPIA